MLGLEDVYLKRLTNMSKGKIHHIKMVAGTKDNTYTRQQFKTYKLAKSPFEKVTVTVSLKEVLVLPSLSCTTAIG